MPRMNKFFFFAQWVRWGLRDFFFGRPATGLWLVEEILENQIVGFERRLFWRKIRMKYSPRGFARPGRGLSSARAFEFLQVS